MIKGIISSLGLIVAPALLLMSACNKDELVVDDKTEGSLRPATRDSKASFDRVYEWTPAPGQFINESSGGGGNLTSSAAAASWAQNRLYNRQYVSLGGFGGYIIVGFDHSIISSDGDYDFAIAGNAFFNAASGTGGSNEPGIVYVMQDNNGNGLPDDEWFELKGSEYGKEETISSYEVTYYRPMVPATGVEWIDNMGNRNTIDYLPSFHKQNYYYPLWIAADSYALKGVCLKSRNLIDEDTGMWDNYAYAWGYVDNMGDDNVEINGFKQCNRFRIADAVKADGTSANLDYIDFVKVQSAVNAKSGWLGEISTEVLGFFDLHL